MLAFLGAPGSNREWLSHGGSETLFSYGVQPIPAQTAPNAAFEAAAHRLAELAPETHLKFLHGLERFALIGDYVFVHAGLDCGRPLEEQDDRDLFWARKRFIEDRRSFEQVVVHGHSPVPTPYRDRRRICLDCGAYATGKLCVGRFEEDRVEVMIVELDDGAGAYWSALR
jgi:serine/threonine protein phosphatase 1